MQSYFQVPDNYTKQPALSRHQRENPDRLRMQKTLTTVLALACGLNLDIPQAQTTEGPLEEIIVTGEYAGPGMWQVTHPDRPGHTLWIVGERHYCPRACAFVRSRWRAWRRNRRRSSCRPGPH